MIKTKVHDYIGQKFNFLTLISDEHIKSGNMNAYKCLCDCGNTHYVRLSELIHGHTKSCGKCSLLKDTKSAKAVIGKKYGKLTPVKPVGEDKHKRIIWLFKCDCGNDYIGPLYNVKSGNTKSCGCDRHKEAVNSLDLIGQKYGRWTVLSKDKVIKGVAYWKCQCACGNTANVPTGALRSGASKSCGCLVDDIQNKESYGCKWAHDVKKLHEVCIKCKCSDHLHAHHIFPRNTHPEMKLNILNGITLCSKCHRKFHRLYGNKCTIENLSEFIGLHPYLTEAAKLMVEGEQYKSNQKMKEALEYMKKYKKFLELGGCDQ